MGSAGRSGTPKAPVLVERFVRQLNIASRASKLYPASSEIPRENAAAAVGALNIALREEPMVRLVVTKDGLLYEGEGVFPDTLAFSAFSRELYTRDLSEVRFHAGCTAAELSSFLSLLDLPADELAASGGFESRLWDLAVTSISVAELTTRIVDHEPLTGPEGPTGSDAGEPWPPAEGRVTELLAGAMAGRRNDERLLVRLVKDPVALRGYLRGDASDSERAPDEAELAGRVGGIANCIRFELPDEREVMLRSLAEAVLDLEPDIRQRLLSDRLIGGSRRDDAIASVIRQMSLDEIMESILHELPETPEAASGVARAIRNLALINLADSRQSILTAAADTLSERGASESTVSTILESVAPQQLHVEAGTRSSEARPVKSVLQLLDLAPRQEAADEGDEEVVGLRSEAARGLTDGDVVTSLVSIATLETRPEVLDSVVAALEDSVGLLLDEREFEVAADAADALFAAAKDTALGTAQRSQLGKVLTLLSSPESVKAITSAMGLYRQDSVEHAACQRLIATLGSQEIGPVLEALADEPDMATRKLLVEIVAGIAPLHIEQLGRSVSDSRWYFVRNVVAILGSTRDPAILGHLERTVRHKDARVRRETIRALSGMREALSEQMLISALADADDTNVQLAIRYLGGAESRAAVPRLEGLARGEGRGRKATALRIEAMEALGRIGAPSSILVLQEIAAQRGLLAGRTKQIRTAAAAALASVDAGRSGTGTDS